MPKATTGGASNAWEQPDGEVFEMSAAWEPEAVPEEQPDSDPAPAGVQVLVGEPGPEVINVPDGDVVAAPRSSKAKKA